jgi:hypothetical protein
MIHRGIKFAYVLIISVAAAMAFIVVRNFDEVAVSGPSYVVLISRSDAAANADRIDGVVAEFAERRSVNIGRLVPDAREPETHRHVYLAVGDPSDDSTRWLEVGYPDFSRNVRTEMHPYREMVDVGPIGYYFVYGPEGIARDFLREFEALGFAGRIDPLFSISHALGYFGQGALLWCFLVIALVVVVTVGSSVVLGAKSYGVQRLQGSGWLRIFGRDVAQIAKLFLVALVLISTATLVSLYLYNGLNQLGTYLLVAGAFLTVFLLFAVVAHLLALLLLYRTGILGAIKGEVSASWAIGFAYCIRLAAVFLALFVGTSLIGNLVALRDSRSRVELWAGVEDAYTMRIGGYGTGQARDINVAIGRWIRAADERHEVILSRLETLLGDPRSRPRPEALDVLVVNERYLAKNAIYDTSGGRVRLTSEEDFIRILIPEDRAGDTERIADRIRAELLGMYMSREEGLRVPVRTETIRAGQEMFTYGSWLRGHDLVLTSPVLVVVTGKSGVISDGDYMAYATSGDVIVENRAAATESLEAAGLASYIQGFYPKTQEAAEYHRNILREANMQMFNLIAAIGVLFVTGLSVAIIYSRKNAQALFVKFISGWRFFNAYRVILLVEVGMALGVLGVLSWRTAAEISARTGPMARPLLQDELMLLRMEPVVAGTIGILGLALVVGTLAYINARIVKAHSASLA